MGRTRSAKKPLLFAVGMAALLLGAALFVAPSFFSGLAPDEAALPTLRIASAFAAAIGIALLALHWIAHRPGDAPASKHDPAWNSQLPVDLLRRHPRGFDHTETPPITRSPPADRSARAAPQRERKA